MKMFLESVRKEVYHPRGRNVYGAQRLIRASFDMVLMRDDESTEQLNLYVMPSSGAPDAAPADAMTENEPAASREMFPYVGDRIVMDVMAFGVVGEDTIQALHFFGSV